MKRRHECAHCGETFPTSSDHAIHVLAAHEPANVNDPRTVPRLRRTISCWVCAKQVRPETLTCSCGWAHPSTREA